MKKFDDLVDCVGPEMASILVVMIPGTIIAVIARMVVGG